jgi:heme/copper-type cytochrome/quinol oxidase subunit 2
LGMCEDGTIAMPTGSDSGIASIFNIATIAVSVVSAVVICCLVYCFCRYWRPRVTVSEDEDEEYREEQKRKRS